MEIRRCRRLRRNVCACDGHKDDYDYRYGCGCGVVVGVEREGVWSRLVRKRKKRVVGGVVQYLQIVFRPLPIREDIRGDTSGCSTTALSHSVCELKLFVRWSVLSCPVLSVRHASSTSTPLMKFSVSFAPRSFPMCVVQLSTLR